MQQSRKCWAGVTEANMSCLENVWFCVTKRKFPEWRCFILAFWVLVGTIAAGVNGAETAKRTAQTPDKLVPLILKLPEAGFPGTPPNVSFPNGEPYDPD